jgi:hypothetical protein
MRKILLLLGLCPGVFLIVDLGMASVASAQGADTGSGLAQTRRGSSDQDTAKQGRVAHVGAGTTNASTTGYSGQSGGPEKATREINVPPLPNTELCDAFRNASFHDACLRVVLREERR